MLIAPEYNLRPALRALGTPVRSSARWAWVFRREGVHASPAASREPCRGLFSRSPSMH